jgi:putative ABC transport system permease protein
MISDYFSFVFRTFAHRKLRSWLTVVGVLIGIAAVVALISLGQGVQNAVNGAFSTIGNDKLIVVPGGFLGPGTGGLTTAKLTTKDIDAIKNVPGVEHAMGLLNSRVRMQFKDQTAFVSLYGVPTDKATMDIASTILFFEIEEGRYLKDTDKFKTTLGYSLSKEAFNKPINLNDKITLEGQTFSVVGIHKKSGSPMWDTVVRIPIDVARSMLNEPDKVSVIYIQLKSSALPNAVKDDVEKALRKERDVKEGKEDFSVILSKDLINTVNSVLGVLQIALVGVAGISLVVGALGIMNTMYTAVAERTKEIGIMKAIGATNHDITMIFLIESGMLGLFGGIIGDILGFSLSKIVEIFAANTGFAILKAYMSVELVVASLVFSFLIGALSGVLPARHAASLKPAEAIRK